MREPGETSGWEWRDAAKFTGWHTTRRMLHSVESTMESGWTEGLSTAEECQNRGCHTLHARASTREVFGWLVTCAEESGDLAKGETGFWDSLLCA